MTVKKLIERYILYIAWVQSLIAMLVSLYYSEILHFAPCVLCWYQRIFMYPLVLLIAIGILRKDKDIVLYVLPFSVIGQGVAFYHLLLQWGIIPEKLLPCENGVSCVTAYVNYFGFISIPLLSFLAFSCITICMFLYKQVYIKKHV